MKRLLLSLILSLSFAFANSVPIIWTGLAGDGKWNTAGNWSALTVPTAIDDVTFPISATVEMDILSSTTYTIHSLLITTNSTVTLQRTQVGGGTRVFQLASTSSSIKGLQIDNGSTLTIDAINTTTGTLNYELAFTGGPGVTGEVSGNLYFKGSGVAGTCSAEIDLQDDGTHYAAFVVKNLGVIKYFTNTGNTGPSTGSYLTMESGSIYEINKNGGSIPPGTWDPNSLTKVNGTGANPPTFFGTVYGNLEWTCPGQIAYGPNLNLTFNNVNFISTGLLAFRVKTGASAGNYTMTINGNLDISATTLIDVVSLNSLATSSGKIILKGHLNNQGTLTTNGISTTTSEFELNGISNQNITNTGTITGTRLTLIMNNAAGATLLTPVTLPYKLTLTSGKIRTTSTNILSMSDNAPIPTGGSSTSFVEGPMKKGGHDNTFTFPIGVGSIYAPATYFSASLTAADTIRAEYVRGNPQSTYGALYDPTNTPDHIDHISFVEYWKLQKTAGAAISHNITLTVTEYSFCKNLNTTFIASYHPSATLWQSCGTTLRNLTGTGGSQEFGTITTTGQSLVDSIFTLGTGDPFASNPLPITLISFDASKLSNSKSTINWELAACCSATAKFEIQRAGTEKHFVTVGTVGGSETNKLYNYIDNGLKSGVNYYRLKMIDADGKITYSRTVAVMNGVNGLLLTSLIPTVVTNTATLTIASSNQQKLDIVIVDMQGRVMLKNSYTVASGNTNIELSLAGLAVGTYQLTGITAEGKINTIRFIKQ
jgi:hypothetical protein